MSRYIDANEVKRQIQKATEGQNDVMKVFLNAMHRIDKIPTADVRENATAHKVVGGGERDGSTCWFECDQCGLAVDIGDVFCKHCGARFVP